MSEVLDQWITLQRTWMYLEPIFSSDDIMQQLPLEGKRFATVDRSWRKAMDAAKRAPGVLKVCSTQPPSCETRCQHSRCNCRMCLYAACARLGKAAA